MNNFLVALGVVFPMLAMMAVGILLRRIGLVDRDLSRRVDAINFRVFLPCLTFINIYNSDLEKDVSWPALIYALSVMLVLIVLLLLVVPRLVKEREKISVICQAIFRGNFVLFGMSITQSLYGEGRCATAALLAAVVVPAMNVAAVIVLESYRPGGKGAVSLKRLISGVAKNPLIIACCLGVLMALAGLRLPEMVEGVVLSMSRVATPVAFIMLGATLSAQGIRKNGKVLTMTVLTRMILLPLAALVPACLLGFRGPELAALMVLFASPTAVSSFSMAQQMGGDGELAAQLVAMTSVTSLGTIFCITYLLKVLGLL